MTDQDSELIVALQEVREGTISVYDAYNSIIEVIGKLRDEAKLQKIAGKEWKEKYKDLNRSITCELRDPYGTIWDCAKRIQDENDALKKEIASLKDRHMRLVDLVSNVGYELDTPPKNHAN
jgi:Mg2+ and Co2+ transporter CorA